MGRHFINWFQHVRALLRLRVARRKAGVQLLWWNYREPVGSYYRAAKSRVADSRSYCFLWDKKVTAAPKKHKRRGKVLIVILQCLSLCRLCLSRLILF